MPNIKQYLKKLNTYDIVKNIFIIISLLSAATSLSFLFDNFTENALNISFIYILALIFIGYLTSDYLSCILASLISILCMNYISAYPYYQLRFTLNEHLNTFLVLLSLSMISSAAAKHIRKQANMISERENLLLEADKEKMRANLLRAISHDLRTPLTGIIGASNIYLENNNRLTDHEKIDLVKQISEDTNWLLNMVENLLSVTRIHDNDTQVTKTPEPIEEVVSEAVFRLKKRLPDASIKVKVPDEFLMIPMDALLIEQVIINLLENAVIHAHSTKPIRFNVVCDLKNVAFHIIDYGIGIDPDKLDTIFNGLSGRLESHCDSSKGMGIGLSICKTIIKAHDGTIIAQNHTDGAEFIFTLPRGGETNESD